MSAPVAEAVALRGAHKRFGSVHAVRGADLVVAAGEVHALIGENGAGKSTVVKMLSGVHVPDEGTVAIAGSPVRLTSPRAALDAGVSTIYQELTLVPDLTVAENILLGREPVRAGLRDRRARLRAAREVLARLRSPGIDPRRTVRTLGVAHQQIVEIAKAVSRPGVRALILDEPTAALTGEEVESLFAVVRGLRAAGLGMLYITHRLDELSRIADRVTVMRDGEVVWTREAAHAGTREVVEAMIGRRFDDYFPARAATPGEVLLEVDGVHPVGGRPVTLQVRAGEVVGLFGLMGSGRTELVRALVGADPRVAGTVRVDGRTITARGPRGVLAQGVGLLPEDRKHQGIVPEMSVARNVALSALPAMGRGPFVSRTRVSRLTREMVADMKIRLASEGQPIASLSGGNQQKCLIGRLLAVGPQVLLLDEPTRGVDVGARADVYRIVNELCGDGRAVLMVTSDLPEALGMCDRVVVLREGAIAGELTREEATERGVLSLALDAGDAGEGAQAAA